jgi:quercetin dioxygenase-like cupin family protein
MTDIEVVPPRGGELVGDSADRRVEILSDHHALHVTWSRFGPGRDGADLHVHHRHTDLFYVLLGELTMRLGPQGEEARVPAGQLVRVPPGVVHGFRNASGAEVRYLNFHAPGVGFADYMRAIRDGRNLSYDQYDPPADGGRATSEVAIGEPFADTEAIRVEEVPLDGGWREAVDGERLWSYFVLDGELAVRAGEAAVTAVAGSWVQVLPGRPHSVGAGGAGAARVLEIGAPTAA